MLLVRVQRESAGRGSVRKDTDKDVRLRSIQLYTRPGRALPSSEYLDRAPRSSNRAGRIHSAVPTATFDVDPKIRAYVYEESFRRAHP